MAGNVWEWVAAPYEAVEAGRQVLRGGSYNFLQDMAYRLQADPAVLTAIVDAGFRCAAAEAG
jgi:formylglycine-generating enzyme required for sulfatase activity